MRFFAAVLAVAKGAQEYSCGRIFDCPAETSPTFSRAAGGSPKIRAKTQPIVFVIARADVFLAVQNSFANGPVAAVISEYEPRKIHP